MDQTCIAPHEIEDWAWQAYLDGESLPAVADHLRRCPACAARAAAQQRWEARLTHALYRFDCPTLDDLRSFVWRALAPVRRQSVADHLAICVPCQDEVKELARVLAAPEQAIQPQRGPRRIDLVGGLRTVWGRLVPAPSTPALALRSQRQGRRQALYQAGATDVALTVEPMENNGYALLGQALAPDPWGEDGRAVVCNLDGFEIAQASLDETGSFTLTGLPPAPWEVHLYLSSGADGRKGDQEIVLVAVGAESGHV